MEKLGKGEVHFQKGAISDVRLENLESDEAFYRLLEWGEGQLQFRPAETVSCPGKIDKDDMQLLMDGLRRLDEQRGGVIPGEPRARG